MGEIVELFRGVTLLDLHPGDTDRAAVVDAVKIPELRSWRQLAPEVSPMGQFLWEVKPPGEWVKLVRYQTELISTSASIPLSVDWAMVFQMLGCEGAGLLARCSGDDLIAVAVQRPGQPATPLAPGFFAHTTIDVRQLDATGLENISEQEYDWPEGLEKPAVIGLQAIFQLQGKDFRDQYLRQYPEGVWLLTAKGEFQIYEVLAG